MMSKLSPLLFLLAFFVVANCAPSDDLRKAWEEFKLKFDKNYGSERQEESRFKIFVENLAKIERHNALYEKGEVSHQLGINSFSDMTTTEFRKTMNGHRPSLDIGQSNGVDTFHKVDFRKLPDEVDWREQGAVTEVKNQKQTGSCWSFGATGSLEGQVFLKTGKLVSLSEQNLIDCSRSFGNSGCCGGSLVNAFSYVMLRGINTEESYPFLARDGSCRFNSSATTYKNVGFVAIPYGDEEALKHAVATVGPITVAIAASSDSFIKYKKGIHYDPNCSSSELDHAVLVVGYGTEMDEDGHLKDYWLVKNSWALNWGMKGYIKMARNANNNCGIATSAVYPTF